MYRSRTRVIGCKLHVSELYHVRIETALLSIAFDSLNEIVLYTGILNNSKEDIDKHKKIIQTLLGPLFREKTFGIHELKGGDFEVIIPNNQKIIPVAPTLEPTTKSNTSES